jgi:hypothetical protein
MAIAGGQNCVTLDLAADVIPGSKTAKRAEQKHLRNRARIGDSPPMLPSVARHRTASANGARLLSLPGWPMRWRLVAVVLDSTGRRDKKQAPISSALPWTEIILFPRNTHSIFNNF